MAWLRRIILLCAVLCIASASRAALQADELLLICNKNIPSSRQSAEFYAKARLVPQGRILALNLPASEEIPFDKYEQEFIPAVRDFLRANHLEAKVRCIVTFFGVPFRIAGHQRTPEENQEIEAIKKEAADVFAKATPAVNEIEVIAKELNPAFTPLHGRGPNELAGRANAALVDINQHLPPAEDPRHAQLLPKLVRLMQTFGGDSLLANKLSDAELGAMLPWQQAKQWPGRRGEIDQANRQAEVLQDKRWDAESRRKLRQLIGEYFGVFGQLGVLHAQNEYLNNDGTAAALDNELALLWWGYYNRSNWMTNPLHYRAAGPAAHPPVVMVTRLDGPQEGTAMQIVLASLKAEHNGLQGKAVIDSTGGTGPGGVPDKNGGYAKFDKRLIDLAEMIRTRSKIPLVLDRSPQLLPPGSVKGVALYCGWYSVRNYVPCCTFVPGAVGFHVASFEMLSLRADNEKGWVAGLLNDGVAATVGSVAEPYLGAFPLPDDFFPLLLTGKLTLAEVYWKTVPMASWMMVCIGDPLYTPFKANPQLTLEDLPMALRRALDENAAPLLGEMPQQETEPSVSPSSAPSETPVRGLRPAPRSPTDLVPPG